MNRNVPWNFPSAAPDEARPVSAHATSPRSTLRSMPAIARNLILAGFVLSLAAPADTHSDIMHMFGSMANALASSNAAEFMKGFDRNMPDYDRIETEVTALLQQGEIATTAQP